MPERLPPPPPRFTPAAPARAPAKTFAIGAYSDAAQGAKIILYGNTGLGKTTLASLAPNPIFVAFDDGIRLIKHPVTDAPMPAIPGVESFQDLRDALHQRGLFPAGHTIVIDTLTKVEQVAERYILDNYTLKTGRATSMRAYGWDGPAHQLDVIRLLLADADPLVHAGVNILFLCQQSQAKVANAEGLDYLQDGPKLSHNNQYSSRMEVCEWADHVLRIGYLDFEVRADHDKATRGKVVGGQTRAVFSAGGAHFIAKSRPIAGKRLPPAVSFETERDDSLWAMMFRGGIP